MKTALIISGGGCKGAFAVGIIKSIYEHYGRDGWFDIIGGTSTGALIAPLAALMKDSFNYQFNALSDLIQLYSTSKTKDILNKKNIFQLLWSLDCFYKSTN